MATQWRRSSDPVCGLATRERDRTQGHPKNFLKIHRYFALTTNRNTIGQSNNAVSLLGFSLADKTNNEQITETSFQGHMKIALTLLSPKSDQSQFSPNNINT